MLGYKTSFAQDATSYSQTWTSDTYLAIGPPAGYTIPAGTYYVFINFTVFTFNNPRFDWGFSPGSVAQNLTNIGGGVVTTGGKTSTTTGGIVTNTSSTTYYFGAAAYTSSTVSVSIGFFNVYHVRIA